MRLVHLPGEGLAVVALFFGACAPAILSAPADPVLVQRTQLMDSFESWFSGFRARLQDRSPESARDCASEAVFVLRNGELWSSREMAPSVVARESLIQVARWEAMHAAAALPEDLRALAALGEVDEIAGDWEGSVWARCRAARLSDMSFDAQAGCARALALEGQSREAASAWKRAFAIASGDTQRFLALRELERLGETLSEGAYSADVLARYRAMVDWSELSTAQRIERLRASGNGKLHDGPDDDEPAPSRLGTGEDQ